MGGVSKESGNSRRNVQENAECKGDDDFVKICSNFQVADGGDCSCVLNRLRLS